MFVSSGVAAGLLRAARLPHLPPQGSPADQALTDQWRRSPYAVLPTPPSGLAGTGFLDLMRAGAAKVAGTATKEETGAVKQQIYNELLAEGKSTTEARTLASQMGREYAQGNPEVRSQIARHLDAALKARAAETAPFAPPAVLSVPMNGGGFLSRLPLWAKIGGAVALGYVGYRVLVKRGPQAVQV